MWGVAPVCSGPDKTWFTRCTQERGGGVRTHLRGASRGCAAPGPVLCAAPPLPVPRRLTQGCAGRIGRPWGGLPAKQPAVCAAPGLALRRAPVASAAALSNRRPRIAHRFGSLTEERRIVLRGNRCAHPCFRALCFAATGIFSGYEATFLTHEFTVLCPRDFRRAKAGALGEVLRLSPAPRIPLAPVLPPLPGVPRGEARRGVAGMSVGRRHGGPWQEAPQADGPPRPRSSRLRRWPPLGGGHPEGQPFGGTGRASGDRAKCGPPPSDRHRPRSEQRGGRFKDWLGLARAPRRATLFRAAMTLAAIGIWSFQ